MRCLGMFALFVALSAVAACDVTEATKVAEVCAASEMIATCPAGSNPVLGAAAEAACGGRFELQVLEESGAAVAQCAASGSCEVLCQFETPCSCGVETLTKEKIVCAKCPEQSCGDGRCEGTERLSCEPGQEGCFACAEDCGGSTCGDGDCTGDESPDTCPQDCARLCEPNSVVCIGTKIRSCAADGATAVDFDCAEVGRVCGNGQCVEPGCGNGVCEGSAGETPNTCPQDCGSVCQPNRTSCRGDVLVSCSADGRTETETDCGDSDRLCAGGQCVPKGVCGNQVCEQGETEASCAADCAATCGNSICENGEEASCPADCTECGDGVCGASETLTCPQDCGVCVPSTKLCLGGLLRVCNANGTAFEDINCGVFDRICAAGECVEAGICGNKACEKDEDQSCPADCKEICGDGDCGAGEDFGNCSADCVPLCGDQKCEGNETPLGCAIDCLATCGNGACDPLEDRTNCAKDCGFCGNGVCEDGYESAHLDPPGALETCLADCVVSGCQQDSDCQDGVDCTVGTCVGGQCAYQPDDSLCAGNAVCIKFAGCCGDVDGDGYAAIECGGSDCDDSDGLVHPGATEPCGGGDRNCNGTHRPSLQPAVPLTDSLSFKAALDVVETGDGFTLMWVGTPESTELLEYMTVSAAGQASAVATVPDTALNQYSYPTPPMMAYSPQTNRTGFVWLDSAGLPAFNWLDASGAVVEADHLEFPITLSGVHGMATVTPSGMAWNDGTWVISSSTLLFNGGGNVSTPWAFLSEAGGITIPVTPPAAQQLISVGNQVIGLGTGNQYASPWELVKTTPSSPADGYVKVAIQSEASHGTCVLDYDGEHLVNVCSYDGNVNYARIAPNGAVVQDADVTNLPITPVDAAVASPTIANGGEAKVGVVALEGNSNVYFFVRNVDGSAVVEPGLVGGGVEVANAHAFHDGQDFVLFWLAKKGSVQQVFQRKVTCE